MSTGNGRGGSRRPPAQRRLGIPRLSPQAIRQRSRAVHQASRGQILFGVVALVAVCSLVGSTVATFGFDLASNRTTPTTDLSANPTIDANSRLIRDQRATVAANPGDAAAMALLARYLQVSNTPLEAIDWYTRALAINPNDTAIRLNFADMLVNADRQGDAELQYQKVLQIDPNNLQATFWLGDLYQYWKPSPRIGEAIAQFDRVLQIGAGTVQAQQAQQRLVQLGVATPAATPLGATPASAPLILTSPTPAMPVS